jgi:ribosomal-protein-alanine N-acetyltransferase
LVTFRIAREEEVPMLAEIGLLAWSGAIAGVAELAGDHAAMRRTAEMAFLSFARSSWNRIRVVEAGDVLGWAARERADGTITDLWVRPDLQRRGLGSGLLQRVEAEMIAEGLDAAEAGTHVANAAAIAFFTSRGYRIAWLSTQYAARLDRDIEQVGLKKTLRLAHEDDDDLYGGR